MTVGDSCFGAHFRAAQRCGSSSHFLALIGAAFAVAASVSLAQAEVVGEASKIKLSAFQTPPANQRAPLNRTDPVERNATLETVPEGALEVTFVDGSKLTMGPGSELLVDEFAYKGPGAGGAQSVKYVKGMFRFISGQVPKENVKLQTPSATIGIRGTIVKTKIEDCAGAAGPACEPYEIIYFEEGSGSVTSRTTGQSVPAFPGTKITLNAQGDIVKVEQTPWLAGNEAVDVGLKQSASGERGDEDGQPGACKP